VSEHEPDWGHEELLDEAARHRDEVHGGGECDCIVPPAPVTDPEPGEPPF
jgi:hypothetical protein